MDETLRVSLPAGILWIVCNGNFDQSNQSTILPCAMLQAGRSGRIGLEADSETCHPSICLLLTLVQDISCTVPNIRYTIPNTKYTVPSTRYTIPNTKYSVKNQMTLKTLIKKIPVVAWRVLTNTNDLKSLYSRNMIANRPFYQRFKGLCGKGKWRNNIVNNWNSQVYFIPGENWTIKYSILLHWAGLVAEW